MQWKAAMRRTAHRTVAPARNVTRAVGGFSILELLVVIAMIGVIFATASPRMASLVAGYRLEGAAQNLALDLQKVRLRAIAQGKCFQVTFNTSDATYQVLSKAGATPCGTIGFANDGSARKVDDAGAIAVVATASPVFATRGVVDTASVVTLTAPNGAIRLVAVNAAGRVNVQ